jgi:hypothetical protein
MLTPGNLILKNGLIMVAMFKRKILPGVMAVLMAIAFIPVVPFENAAYACSSIPNDITLDSDSFNITISYTTATDTLTFSGHGDLGAAALDLYFLVEGTGNGDYSYLPALQQMICNVKTINIASGITVAPGYFTSGSVNVPGGAKFAKLQQVNCDGAVIQDALLKEKIASFTEAPDTDAQGITYTNAQHEKISDIQPTASSIVIPKSVTSLASTAFDHCGTSLQSISVEEGNSVYSAASGVLYKNGVVLYSPKGLSGDVVVPEGVTSIKVSDFSDRSGMTSLSLPASLTGIDYAERLFSNDKGLTDVTVASGNTVYKAVDKVLYGDGGKTALDALPSLSGAITIPDGVTSIGSALSSSNITSVTLPSSVTALATSAFDGSSSLSSVTLPESITTIGDNAFRNCTALQSLHIPASVTSISQSAFSNCTNLKSFDIAEGGHFRFEDGVLYDLKGTIIFETAWPQGRSYITFPAGITTTTIPAEKFLYGGNSFSACYNTLNTIVSNNDEYKVVNGVLFSDDMKTLIKAPISLSGVYVVPDSVTSISSFAFAGCSNVMSIVMPQNGVENIGSNAFTGVPLRSIQLPATLWSKSKASDFASDPAQGFALFGSAASVASLPAADDTTNTTVNHTLAVLDLSLYGQSYIPGYVFSCLYGLSEVTIPKNVMTLGNGSFFGCPNLKKVYAFNQNLQIAADGMTGDPTLGWTAATPTSFSTLASSGSGYKALTGITFYGLNYSTNTTKAYADQYGCSFMPFAFLGNYDDAAKMANKVEGGSSTLDYLTKSNTVSVGNMAYTGSALTPAVTVNYSDSSDPAIKSRTLVPGDDCTVVYRDSVGNEVSKIVNPGTYTATVKGDEKSVFGTATTTFTVTGPAGTDVKVADASGTGITANGSLWGSNVDGVDASAIQLAADSLSSGDAYNALMASLGNGNLAGVFDVHLMANGVQVHDDFGTITLTFPVDASYNGRTATVWHRHTDGTITSQQTTVVDGKVSVVVSDLSAFAIEIAQPTATTSQASAQVGASSTQQASEQAGAQQSQMAKTGDDMLGFVWAVAGAGMGSAVIAAGVLCRRKRSENHRA